MRDVYLTIVALSSASQHHLFIDIHSSQRASFPRR